MSTRHKEMLDVLGDAIATAATLVRGDGTTANGQVWTHDAVEDETTVAAADRMCGDPYTVLRMYPGPAVTTTGNDVVSVQALTRGSVVADAWTQAQAVYDALRNADGSGKTDWSIGTGDSAFVVQLIGNLRPPGQIGRDDRGRVEVVTNFNVAYVADV